MNTTSTDISISLGGCKVSVSLVLIAKPNVLQTRKSERKKKEIIWYTLVILVEDLQVFFAGIDNDVSCF